MGFKDSLKNFATGLLGGFLGKVKDKAVNTVPGFVTTTGAGIMIANAINGIAKGDMQWKEALFQIAIGIVAVGLRRAIARL